MQNKLLSLLTLFLVHISCQLSSVPFYSLLAIIIILLNELLTIKLYVMHIPSPEQKGSVPSHFPLSWQVLELLPLSRKNPSTHPNVHLDPTLVPQLSIVPFIGAKSCGQVIAKIVIINRSNLNNVIISCRFLVQDQKLNW